MRIVCPNCDAQYEVPTTVIPHEGRDVECSNCGQMWYQHHPDYPAFEDMVDADPLDAEIDDTQQQDPPQPSENAPEVETLTETDAERNTGTEDDKSAERPEATKRPKRRELDPGVADILREEAERERVARGGETLEVQTDLNLPPVQAAPPSAPAAVVVAPTPTPAPKRALESAADNVRYDAESLREPSSRRELLPDIEEINSTLRSTSDRHAAGNDPSPDAPIRRRQKRSFRRGFFLSILLASAGGLLYVFAPQVGQNVPPLTSLLDDYVATVDTARLWLTQQMTELTQWLAVAAAASQQ